MRLGSSAWLVSLMILLAATSCRGSKRGTSIGRQVFDCPVAGSHKTDDPYRGHGPPDEKRENVREPTDNIHGIGGQTDFEGEDAADGEYATSVSLNAGCLANPKETAVAKNPHEAAQCEHMVAAGVRKENGESYEVNVPFEWYAADQSVLNLSCLNGEASNVCSAVGRLDIFDVGGSEEPHTEVWACAVNDCQESPPSECQDLVCDMVVVKSVVNVEGVWALSGATFESPKILHPAQDGRDFEDYSAGIEGSVLNDTVTFEIDDYMYNGKIAHTRDYMGGDVIEMMGMSVIGEWQAHRLKQ